MAIEVTTPATPVAPAAQGELALPVAPAAPVVDTSHLTAAEAEALKDGIGDTNEAALVAAAAKAVADAEAATAAAAALATPATPVVGPVAPVDPVASALAAQQAAQQAALEQASANTRAALAAQQAALAAAPPAAPKDFDAAYAALQEKWDNGDLTHLQLAKETNTLGAEQAAHAIAVANWNAQQESLKANIATNAETSKGAWNAAVVAWQAQNAEFVASPLRVAAMRQAIADTEAKSPNLSNAELLAEAYKSVVADLGYKAPTAIDPAKLEADRVAAINKRAPEVAIPQTLATLPAQGDHELGTNAAFAALDALGIDELENAMARMAPDAKEAYLRAAPGATATGRDPG